jgi:RNA polymerase sigma-70 factor (ECF subfamily)
VPTEDEGLIERARGGDRQAFGELVRKHQKRVYATALHLTGNHGDADDVAQEAFIRAYKGLPRFDGRADFFTWLYRIVVNTALNQLRSRKRSPSAPEDAPERADHGTPDPRASAESREALARCLTALSELSPTLRITLVLAAVEEMPYAQIARVLEVPEGTVAWRVNQARKLLRQKLAQIAPETITEGSTDDVLRRTKEALGAHR